MSSYHPGTELPAPSATQIEHSARLIECIVERIAQNDGVISFRDYMQACLYEPGLGYYAAGSAKLGSAGDFVTAPEISPLFGQTWGKHIAGLFEQGLDTNVLEFGAGSGRLALDIVQTFASRKVQWQGYYIIETSADLRQRQQTLLQQQLSAQDFARIHWLEQLPELYHGMVIGNEVLDAMPLNVLLKDGRWLELGVGFKQDRFVWKAFSEHSDAVQAMRVIDQNDALPAQYCSEINLNIEPWLQALGNACQRVVVELIDYGYERAQYYHPARMHGTLMCFYRHRSHADPLIYPGLQDITAFVDFDRVADAALEAGFEVSGLTTQAMFLMANGLLEAMPVSDDAIRQLAQAQQIKTLTLPGEMGEKFKVIALQKNINLTLKGF